jgi:hypothetical protein
MLEAHFDLGFMLHHICDVIMARGTSGRFVIELDPETKRDFYAALSSEGLTVKEWFARHVGTYIAERSQPSLPGFSADQSVKISPPRK